MTNIGRMNRLKVIKQVEFGMYLDGENFDSILLPKRYVPKDCKVGDWLDVFIYLDSEDRLIATTEKPLVMVGECAHLKVVSTTRIGAFVDWGLSKDLFVPFGEQAQPMEVGYSYTVYVFIDKMTNRIAASTKLSRYLDETGTGLEAKQPVDLMIYQRTDLGYMAVINNTHTGLLFKSEVLQPLNYGPRVKGYIKDIRKDKKIDLCLQLQGQEARDELSQKILDYLKANNGVTNLTDKSAPDAIYKEFAVSKGAYKRALGALYKQRLIMIEKDKVTLL